MSKPITYSRTAKQKMIDEGFVTASKEHGNDMTGYSALTSNEMLDKLHTPEECRQYGKERYVTRYVSLMS